MMNSSHHKLCFVMLAVVTLWGVDGVCDEKCSIFIDSDPTGAEVILDTVRLGVVTPVKLEDIPPGFHIIRLQKGELEGEKRLTLQPSVISRIVVPLTTRQTFLLITSEPAGAQVIIDGKPRGQTPYQFQAATLTGYIVELQSIGYLPEKKTVELAESGTTELHVVLRQYGELFVTSDPSIAEIFINGEFSGRTPSEYRLPEGTHDVILKRAGSKDFVDSVDVVSGDIYRLAAKLIPENGELTIEGLPSGSSVSLDGDFLGYTPLVQKIVPSGPHWLDYRSEGFETMKEPLWISIKGQQETMVTLELQVKTRWNAIWRSTLFPGFGQIYSEQPLKGVSFLGVGALCIAGSVLYQYQVENAQENYRIAHDRYVKEVSPFAITAARETMVAKHDLLREKVDYRNMLVFSAAAVWALNVLDQVLFSTTPWRGGVKATTRISFHGKINERYAGAELSVEL